MDDSELDKKLKAAREPALDADYQEAFPRLVLAGVGTAPRRQNPPERAWLPRLAWGLATAACLVVAFAAGHWSGRTERATATDALADAKLVHETLAMFPNRVRAIVQDERGLNLVLSDRADVPASTPIYVRICEGGRCASLVTFSGQEIQIAGQKLTVLSQADGGIILEGNKFLWSTGQPLYADKNLKIEARNLGPAIL
jgi:hypothetical protein